jgi:two-component system, NtrC family, response regulator AtoC
MSTLREWVGEGVSTTAGESPALDVGLLLRVVGEKVFSWRALPETGDLVLGRSEQADVRIEDPSVSRRHAVLHLGPPLSIEDLGSANGTRVGERELAKGERYPIQAGEAIELGSVIVLVHRARKGSNATASPATAIASADGAPIILSGTMRELERVVERIAGGDISVLLLGETGVGKEVMAEEIHRRSPRANNPLLRLNCGALSGALLESELFGHEKGAFTGAVHRKRGLLEMAEGGTVFLDEVGELPLDLQVKLLRVLEDRQVWRIGAERPVPIDVRFVSATNRDLQHEMERGTFRQDLFFRLNGISLYIPPLRERVAEIAPLSRLFVAQACERSERRRVPELSAEALAALERYDWPGNVRELRNVIERGLLLCTHAVIRVEHLVLPRRAATITVAPNSLDSASGASDAKPQRPEPGDSQDSRQRILDALARCAGNQTQAARLLGISRNTLMARLELYGLPRPRKKRR